MLNPNTIWDTSWSWFFLVRGFNVSPPAGFSFIITEDNNLVVTETSDNTITDGL
jgi:hypothetical protein